MIKWISKIDYLNERIGKSTSWLSLVLVLVIVTDVFFRYVFNITSPASFELEWHLFAALFLLTAGWTLQQDKHVRVDVFYQKFNPRTKAWINLLGGGLLLLPFCIIGCVESLFFVKNSFLINETSPDPGGLPARYLIKSTLPMGFFLLGLQAISSMLSSLKKILE